MDVTFAVQGPPKVQHASLHDLVRRLKYDIEASAQTETPQYTTIELILSNDALIPLLRPSIGPYAEGGEQDLPAEFKSKRPRNSQYANKDPQPQATVRAILSVAAGPQRKIVQRAASRGVVAAVENVDGFKYSFNNAWAAKDADGQRYSYICQDSMQNKDRHANGFTRTQKHLKGEGERGVRKPTFDCKGSVGVKFSLIKSQVVISYRHNAIHPTLRDRESAPAKSSMETSRTPRRGVPPVHEETDDGGLYGKLVAEMSTYNQSSNHQTPSTAVPPQPSNIGRPLKRSRGSDYTPATPELDQSLSLVDLLKRSERSESMQKPPKQRALTPTHKSSGYPVPVTYDLPSWQTSTPRTPSNANIPLPRQRPLDSLNPSTIQVSSRSIATQPLAANLHAHPPHRPPIANRNQATVPTPHMAPESSISSVHPSTQSLFTTLKPVAPVNSGSVSYDPYAINRAKSSCTNCRYGKRKCDERRPICTACEKSSRFDCIYEGAAWAFPPTIPPWPPYTSPYGPGPPVQQFVPQVRPAGAENPEMWLPKR